MSGAQVIYPVSSCPLVSAGASLHFMVSWFTPSAAPVHVTAFEAASVHKTLTEPHKEGNILPKENLIIVRKIMEKGHSMGITIEELKKLDKNTYQIIDIRDENEVAHGAIPRGGTPQALFCRAVRRD